jgi:nucleotide-binding universal stress UspA family protein
MAFRSILVHLADDPRHALRLDLALEMARRHKAHLTALYTHSSANMPAGIEGRGASLRYIAEAAETGLEKTQAMAAEFEEHCQQYGITGEWHFEEGDPLDLLAQYAHLADLTIVSQTDPATLEDRLTFHRMDHLALSVGCPVLVIPREGEVAVPGSRILIAWKPHSQSARAVHEALPLLEKAERVTVFSVVPAEHDFVPGADIATRLARHGVKVEVRSDIGTGGNTGEVILATARDIDCDLIVMGAYGHSRLREMVLGGVSYHVLNHATIPVLTSH